MRWVIAILACGWLVTAPVPSGAQATRGQVGEWSTPVNHGFIAVHAALLRGPADSSRVLYFRSGDLADLWRFRPGAAYDLADVIHVPCASNIFCSGHATLRDGRLLIANGHVENFTGLDDANIFDPKTNRWTLQRVMFRGHWYPTVTSLANGQLLVSGGSQFFNLEVFGGFYGHVLGDLSQLSLDDRPGWANIAGLSPQPSARQDHAAIYEPTLQSTVIFGGRDSGGGALSDAWALTRTDNNTETEDYRWKWDPITVAPDPIAGLPPARSRHTAISFPSRSAMIVYGGLASNLGALGDTWMLTLRRSGSGVSGQWKKLNVAGPVPRSGHSAIFATDVPWLQSQGLDSSMVVFGGQSAAGYTDSVWVLKLTAGAEQWLPLAVLGPAPLARSGHSATLIPGRTYGNIPQRMLVFGGQNASQYFNDTWGLEWRSGGPAWAQLRPFNPPPARARHAAFFDDGAPSVFIVGGETAPGVETNDIELIDVPTVLQWSPYPTIGGPPGWAGESAIRHPRPVLARVPELYASTPDDSGSWQELSGLTRKIAYYPFMFLLPDGRVFMAGNDMTTRIIHPGSWDWDPVTYPSLFFGGSAVQFRPGRILKHGVSEGSAPSGETATIDLTIPNPVWAEESPSIARDFSNLTLLPTGDVLLTGGCTSDTCTSQRSPQLWRPGPGWGALLAPEPTRRDYHSTTLLLPDARVMTSGGDHYQPDQFEISIFSPPYLFTAAGDPASRPAVTGAPGIIEYAKPFAVLTPQAASIASAVLMRPGAVTHAFNQNQRYVPLSSSAADNPARLVIVAPADSNLAPPGDYLLFIVSSDGVPSVGRWVSIGSGTADVGVPPALTGSIALEPAANPASAPTLIRFSIPDERAGQPLRLSIYDLSGRRIRELARGGAEPGEHSVEWNLRDEAGENVRGGVYFARLSVGGATLSRRLSVLR